MIGLPDEQLTMIMITTTIRIVFLFLRLSLWSTVLHLFQEEKPGGRIYLSKAQDVVTTMLAKGSAIRQDAVNKAKAFDEKHQLTANASAKVSSFDKRVGLTEKLTVGLSVVNEKVKSVDQRLHVSDKTMAAIFAAERKLNDTGSAVKTSRFGLQLNLIPYLHCSICIMMIFILNCYGLVVLFYWEYVDKKECRGLFSWRKHFLFSFLIAKRLFSPGFLF